MALSQKQSQKHDNGATTISRSGRPDNIVPFSSDADARARMRDAPSSPLRLWATHAHSKRIFDVVAAGALLVLLMPALAAIWAGVRLTSPGPGLYWSARIGAEGRPFFMPKFRTMVATAPVAPREALAGFRHLDTPIARFLRKSSLDELPQLWCILWGQMTLVGPRPLLPEDPGVRARLAFPESMRVRPGLTGLAQIRGRNFVTPRRKARFDAFYAQKANFFFDLAILARTIIVVMARRDVI